MSTGLACTGRATRRAPFFARVLALLLVGLLVDAHPAHGELTDATQLADATPTWWHEAAGLTPLLTAPPPPNPATICVIDTGVTPTPDLDITARWAYDGGTPDDVRATEDSPGHGTLVAHFAAGAVNGWGGAGAFPHARISSVRVFPNEGGASWQDYIRAITRCLKLDAHTKVIVISIGGQTIDPGEADELAHWIGRARDRHEVNVVAAAGNGGELPDFPARFAEAFSVTGVGADGALCPFAARGSGVDIAAPGCGLVQSDPNGGTWSVDGTSFAAPIVAGALAAIRSYAPEMGARVAEDRLINGARPAEVPVLDVREALAAVGLDGRPGSSVTTPLQPTVSSPPPAAPVRAGALPERLLPRPRVAARRVRGGVLLVARNRPSGATFEVRVGRRALRRRTSRLIARSRAHVGRCRFLAGGLRSPWITVRF